MKILWLVSSDAPAAVPTSIPRRVGDVVAVRLQEPDHRVLGVHQPAAALVVIRGVERPVVRDLRRRPCTRPGLPGGQFDRALVQAVAAVGVVGLPRLVGGLEEDVGVARVVAHDERRCGCRPVASSRTRCAMYTPGHRRRRHRPGRRHRPVPAVDQARRLRVGEAGGLGLRQATPTASAPTPPCGHRCPGSSPAAGCRSGSSSTGVLILNCTVSPGCTLIDVAKPWIVGDPEPEICQSLAGSPGSVFSQAITLTTGGPHGPAAAAGVVWAANGSTRPATAATAAITEYRTRQRHGRSACETGRELRGHRSSYQR